MTISIEAGQAMVVSSTSAVTAVAAQHFGLGLPLPEIMAAFAGASLILSFIKPKFDENNEVQGKTRTFCTILFCTFLGTLLAPWLGGLMGFDPKYSVGNAFAVAAIGQVMIPILLDKREVFVKAVLKKFGIGE